ncbi:hypothetical protein GCM10020218_049340 [Dactylosporangium vinaceum]
MAGRGPHRPARRLGTRAACASPHVLPTSDGVLATYDGRATAEENWEERTGVATGTFGALTADRGRAGLRRRTHRAGCGTLTLVTLAGGRRRLYYEMTRADGAHELRTEVI